MEFVLVAVGFALLIKGADWLVESAKTIAFALGVSAIVIGMSVVALGTSMPEAVIGVISAIDGNNGISLGNVVGSDIVNVALNLGIGAIILPIAIHRRTILVDMPVSLLAQSVLMGMMLTGAMLTRVHGFVLLVLFAGYCLYLYRQSKAGAADRAHAAPGQDPTEGMKPEKPGAKTVILLLLGLAGLVGGGKLVVDNAVAIARMFGMTETLIGVTVVALGTALPELVTTIVASVKKQADIAIGNVLGSNILNIYLVLGLSATINPIAVQPGAIVAAAVMLGTTVALIALCAPRKRLGRVSGVVLLAIYAAFIAYSIYTA